MPAARWRRALQRQGCAAAAPARRLLTFPRSSCWIFPGKCLVWTRKMQGAICIKKRFSRAECACWPAGGFAVYWLLLPLEVRGARPHRPLEDMGRGHAFRGPQSTLLASTKEKFSVRSSDSRSATPTQYTNDQCKNGGTSNGRSSKRLHGQVQKHR